MEELIKDNPTLDSREVAEMVGKNHKELLRDIRTYEEYLGGSNFALTDYFIPSTYISSQNKELPNYKLTKSGCELIAHKLTGQKGIIFTATYIKKFRELEAKAIKPLTQQEIMRIQLNMIDDLDVRVDKLENTMTIDYGQQQVLKKKVNAVVVRWLDGKRSFAYKKVGKKVFSECNRDIQDYFNVNSRNNIPKLKFEEAINYIEEWQPSTNTKMMISNYNNQLAF